MLWRQVAWVLLALVLPCMVFWAMNVQMHMMPDRGHSSAELQHLRSDLLDRTSVIVKDLRQHDKDLKAVQDSLAKFANSVQPRLVQLAEEQTKVKDELIRLSELINSHGAKVSEAEQHIGDVADRFGSLAALASGANPSPGTAEDRPAASADLAALLRESGEDTQGDSAEKPDSTQDHAAASPAVAALPSGKTEGTEGDPAEKPGTAQDEALPPVPEQLLDGGFAAEVADFLHKYTCPEGYPYPYKVDDLLIPNHCCKVAVNCNKEPISSTKEFECCGAEDVPMPITYRYEPPNGTSLECDKYPWWRMLEGTGGPFWPLMKHAAEKNPKVKKQSPASADSQPDRERRVWAGGNDSSLAAADVNLAIDYVGSAWGRSGWRQFETAQKFMGLRPEHNFLEIGCGALNAGQFFLSYLDVSRYVCVEPNTVLYNLSVSANSDLQRNISRKRPAIVARDDFDPRPGAKRGRLFDRSWSHSVLSHAADWQLMQYFEVMAAVLQPSTGVGMASMRFSDGMGAPEIPTHDTSWVYPGVSYFDFPEAQCMALRAGLELSLVPEGRLFMTEVVPNELHDWVRMRRP